MARRLFIANEDIGKASAIDVRPTESCSGSFDVGGEPEGVNMRPDGGVVYITSEEDNRVTVIDTATLKPVATIRRRARGRGRRRSCRTAHAPMCRRKTPARSQ